MKPEVLMANISMVKNRIGLFLNSSFILGFVGYSIQTQDKLI